MDPIEVRDKVLELLGWDQEQWAWFQYECGIAYLEEYLEEDVEGIAILEREPMFWAWWRMAWLRRDEWFASEVTHAETSPERIYRNKNGRYLLKHNLHMPRMISMKILEPEKKKR